MSEVTLWAALAHFTAQARLMDCKKNSRMARVIDGDLALCELAVCVDEGQSERILCRLMPLMKWISAHLEITYVICTHTAACNGMRTRSL